MLQVVVVVVAIIVIVMIVVMVAVVAGADAVLHAVRDRQNTSVLLPGAGRRRTARIPLQELADREPMLMHRIRRHVLHLRALMQMRVGVRVVQVLTVMRYQRRGLPRVPAGSRMENGRCRLKPGDRHGRRRRQRESSH